jgi:hypothetical protein
MVIDTPKKVISGEWKEWCFGSKAHVGPSVVWTTRLINLSSEERRVTEVFFFWLPQNTTIDVEDMGMIMNYHHIYEAYA